MWSDLSSFAFGDTKELNEELLASTLSGTKTATCWAASGPLARVGACCVILDSCSRPRALIKIKTVDKVLFNDVDESFAFREGAKDRTLAGWRKLHKDYFTRLNQFTENMLVNCVTFELVEALPLAEPKNLSGDVG
jgi:uncharacterized protein YhfF